MNPLHAFSSSFPCASFPASPHDTTKADGRRPAVDQDDLQAAVSIYSVLGSCLIGSLLCISWKLPKLGDPLQISVTAVKKQTCMLAVMHPSGIKWQETVRRHRVNGGTWGPDQVDEDLLKTGGRTLATAVPQ